MSCGRLTSRLKGGCRQYCPPYMAFAAFVCLAAFGQEVVSLDQAAARTGTDYAAVYEGRTITVRGQIAAPPIWVLGMDFLSLRDAGDHGLILRGEHERFAGYEPGDWVEARGKIETRAGLPVLVPDSMERVRQGPPPSVKSLPLSSAASLRYLGLPLETRGTVTRVGENAGGTVIQLYDRGATASVFLPRSPTVNSDLLTRIHVGDRVSATGLMTQYANRPPYSGDFQVMLGSAADLKASAGEMTLTPLLVLGVVLAGGLFVGLWWLRERRIDAQHRAMRTFHTLCEEIIAAPSPSEIAEKMMTVLPSITQATGAWLYIFNRRTKSLERVPTDADPEPMVVPIETQGEEELANGAAVCFQNRAQLNIPDVRRSQYLNTRTKQNSPRSAMIVPLTTQGDVLGVLEAGNANRLGYFTIEEQASIQHLANQVAAALKLQEQRAMREQLFRSEKLAATGQLISGVANELRAPLESILHLATSLAERHAEVVPDHDLRLLAGESRRASEIVSRLVSFAKPEDAETRNFDVHALLAGLVQFREPEWRVLGLRLQNRLAPEPAFVLGAAGQIEQVFLNLLVHAEQSAADVPSKTVSVASSVIAGRVMVEIGFSARPGPLDGTDGDPFSDSKMTGAAGGGLSLSVCRSIAQNHGGGIRFSTRDGLARFEVELPVLRTETNAETGTGKPERTLTILLVDPDPGPQRQILGLLSLRGHRVVPAGPDEAADLAQRLRFDAVLWAMRLSGPTGGAKWSEFQERTRGAIGAFVLVSDGYDAELARSIEQAGNFLLGRPIQESDLDRILRAIDIRTPAPARR